MDDVRAVMDAVGSQPAFVLGISEGGHMSMLFSATYPERTRALVLYGSFPRIMKACDYPWAFEPEQAEPLIELADERGVRHLLRRSDCAVSAPGSAAVLRPS